MRKRAKFNDMERIIMGDELCDINFAQELLKRTVYKTE